MACWLLASLVSADLPADATRSRVTPGSAGHASASPWPVTTQPFYCTRFDTSLCNGDASLPRANRRGLRRDSLYFIGYQVATIGVLYVMPESVSGWSDEQRDDYSLSEWWDNVQRPTMDEDDFVINYVLHPYWGAAYYVRARERGLSKNKAFWYSAALSATYEFGAEALFEQPSIQDLIVTPVGGMLVGNWFIRVRERAQQRARARGYETTAERWALRLTDPLGAMNRQVDHWFGRDTHWFVAPFYDTGIERGVSDRRFGFYVSIRW